MMTVLRILNALAWGAMVLYMVRGAWAAVSGVETRRGDPMRLGCVLTGLVILGFNLRWLLIPDSIVAWQALYVLSIAVALYIVALARAYGRGPRV